MKLEKTSTQKTINTYNDIKPINQITHDFLSRAKSKTVGDKY